jgi:hypothetical protein
MLALLLGAPDMTFHLFFNFHQSTRPSCTSFNIVVITRYCLSNSSINTLSLPAAHAHRIGPHQRTAHPMQNTQRAEYAEDRVHNSPPGLELSGAARSPATASTGAVARPACLQLQQSVRSTVGRLLPHPLAASTLT